MNYFIERNKCPVCHSKQVNTLYKLPYVNKNLVDYLNDFYGSQGCVEHSYLEDAEYCLDECSVCGLVYQRYIPNDLLMFKLYEEWIDPKIVLGLQSLHRFNYYEKYAHEIMNLILYLKKPVNELNFLDYGMGWGKWCLMAKAFGCNVYGTELSKARIDYARDFGVKTLDLTKSNDFKFDYINTDQVFEHIPDPYSSLSLLKQHLKPNGVLKISVPNGKNVKAVLNKMNWGAPKGHIESINMVAPLEHINCFSRQTLLYLANELGFKPIELPVSRRIYKSKKDFFKQNFKSLKNSLFVSKSQSTTIYFQLRNQT